MKNIAVTVISLLKNNHQSLEITGKSILDQDIDFPIEWLIIDGSNKYFYKKDIKILNNLKKKKNPFIQIIQKNMSDLEIIGIYPCMNYGLKISKGFSIIFLNCGDFFVKNNSLSSMYSLLLKLNKEKSFVFGQANIFASKKLSWLLPGNRINNIEKWLKYFDPNHQSMLITKNLAKNYIFDENCMVIADGIWKREIINNSDSFSYIKQPVITFGLEGVSNKRPTKKIFLSQMKSKKVSKLRKFIIFIKFLIPKKVYTIYPFFQKSKAFLIDIFFKNFF